MDLKRARQSKNVADVRGANQTGFSERPKVVIQDRVDIRAGKMYRDSMDKVAHDRKVMDVSKTLLTPKSLGSVDTPSKTKDYNVGTNDLRTTLPELASKDLIANRKYSGPASKLRKSK